MTDAAPPTDAAAVPAAPAAPLTLADKLGIEGAVMRTEKDGIPTVVVPSSSFAAAATALRDGQGYIRFLDVCVVDLVETGRADRFEVHLLVYSMSLKAHARLKTYTAAKVPSLCGVFEGAHNYEREAFDLYGVVFEGHPALTRILLPDGWQGHPMRRDAEQPFEPVDFTVTRALYNT